MLNKIVVGLALVLATAGCDKKKGGDGASAGQAEAAPTKDNLVATLKKVNALLEAKKYGEAVAHFALPEGMPPAKAEEAVSKLIDRDEISAKGIEILASKGNFGKLADIAPKAKRRAERSGVPFEECYGLGHESAEVMAHWDGSSFKLFRLDDVGKLTRER